MALKTNKWAAATSLAAAFSMLATPVAAAELPSRAEAKVYDSTAENVQRHRWGWGRYRNRVDVGDVLTGVLILGGIAAIANAAKNSRERTEGYPVPYPRGDDYRYRTPGAYDRSESRGMDRAVDMCVDEVERDGARVVSVDSANRDAAGWRVSGELEGGSGFHCSIDNSGRISEIGGSGTAYAEPVEDGQWSDEDYARAREAQSAAESQANEGDGRYTAAEAPDFS